MPQKIEKTREMFRAVLCRQCFENGSGDVLHADDMFELAAADLLAWQFF